MALRRLHLRQCADAHDMRDLRDAADGGGAETVLRLVDGLASVDGLLGGGATAVLRLVNIRITVDDALRVQRVGEHGPRVGLFLTKRSALHKAHGRVRPLRTSGR